MKLTNALDEQDRYVMERHKQIYPTKSELELVLSLSDKTERALKKVSDKLCSKVSTSAFQLFCAFFFGCRFSMILATRSA